MRRPSARPAGAAQACRPAGTILCLPHVACRGAASAIPAGWHLLGLEGSVSRDPRTMVELSGRVVFLPAGSDGPRTPPGAAVLVGFEAATFATLASHLDAPSASTDAVTAPKMAALVRALLRLGRSPGPSPAAVAPALWTALARMLVTTFGAVPRRRDDTWLAPEAIRRVVELVERDLAGDLSLDVLARCAGLSASAFQRAFRGSLGATPSAHVRRRRLARADELLAGTGLPVATVAALTGFRSPAHFATTYGSRSAMSPMTARRHFRESPSTGST